MYGLLNLIVSSASFTMRLLLRAWSCAISKRLTALGFGFLIILLAISYAVIFSLTCYILSQIRVDVKHLFALVTLEPIGVSPLVSLFVADVKLLIASAA